MYIDTRGIGILFVKELRAFLRSSHVVHSAFFMVIVVYAGVIVSHFFSSQQDMRVVWWLLFAMVMAGHFANRVYVFERITGALEMLFVSGVSRGGVLAGKVLFCSTTSLAAGVVAAAIAWVILAWIVGLPYHRVGMYLGSGLLQYITGSLLFTCTNACLAVVLGNPRLMHFVNLALLALLVMANTLLRMPVWALHVSCIAVAAVFYLIALRVYHGERIVYPADE